jgi:hypothetical protein
LKELTYRNIVQTILNVSRNSKAQTSHSRRKRN